ncbi:hypothetical protein AYO42_03480 [Rhizomicrobium sp. SCGC AG-212-E05]|nr:hypothetical protein AYO42_03480 [Rhizomicrobium sp. SCGC AG-212-E05]
MSTDGQLKGDSLRRQLEQSAKYAAEHGLELVPASQLADYGVSAFKGQNVTTGALGRFLEAVKAGTIRKGSYLLVESLDRLSRQDPRVALSHFLDIVNQGIVLVTLADQRKYTTETATLESLMYSLIVMSRAHEESQTKSQRISAAWANKRAMADKKIITGRCPAWLKLKTNQKEFDLIPERVGVIERIFDEARAGIGAYKIARRLNADNTPAFVTKNGWHKSSVDKILTGRAVLGEFQPHRLIEGKRVPVGEVVYGYFPKIIEQDTYDAAQAHRLSKRKGGGGRQGSRFSNLFTKIGRCAYCGGPMRYENKGKGVRGGRFLACDNSQRGKGCVGGRWKYENFEASFLTFVEEIDLGSFAEMTGDAPARAGLETTIQALTGRIGQAEVERENAYKLITQPGIDIEYVGNKLRTCEESLVSLNAQLKDTQTELSKYSASVTAYYQSREDLGALVEEIGALDGKDGYTLRAGVAAKLKAVISNLEIGPLGSFPGEALPVTIDEVDKVDALPFFKVTFRDGTVRIVAPHRSEPRKLEMMIAGPSHPSAAT